MSSRSLTQSTPWEVRSIGRPSLLSVSPCSVPSNLPNYANQPKCKNDGLVHSERGDWLHAGSSPVGSDQKVVVIADPGIRRTRPPETAVLAYRAVVAWEVRGSAAVWCFWLSHSHAARGRSRVAPGFVIKNHTQVTIANLCGSAPYPALIQIDAIDGRGCCSGLVELACAGA